MISEQVLIEKFKILPPEKQQELVDFAEFLEEKTKRKEPRKSSYGLLADLNISISKEEIDEARRETWANFPREDFFDKEQDK
ncbi:MAG: DUF2281 domain-containing protein [Pyrinomonadaceae bacterium]